VEFQLQLRDAMRQKIGRAAVLAIASLNSALGRCSTHNWPDADGADAGRRRPAAVRDEECGGLTG
jgi:hypothetical protein